MLGSVIIVGALGALLRLSEPPPQHATRVLNARGPHALAAADASRARRARDPHILNGPGGPAPWELAHDESNDVLKEQHAALEHRLETVRAQKQRAVPPPTPPPPPPPPPVQKPVRAVAETPSSTAAPVGVRGSSTAWGCVLGLVVALGLAGAIVPAGQGPLRVLAAAAVQLFVAAAAALIGASLLHHVGEDALCAMRTGTFFLAALSIQYCSLAAGRQLWFAGWKNAEAKDLDLVLDWRDHGPGGFLDKRTTQQHLSFHAQRLAFMARPWGRPVRIQPGFSFALYLRGSLDTVLSELLVMSATSTAFTVLLVCASVPLWTFAGVASASTRRLSLLLCVAAVVSCVLAVTLHLRSAVFQLTPHTASLRHNHVSPPPYLDRRSVAGVTKHMQLFKLGPPMLLDMLRASLVALSLAAAVCAETAGEGWEGFAALALIACATALLPAAIALMAVSTSVEMLVRHDLLPLCNRSAPKRTGYRRILQLVKVKAVQQSPTCVRQLGEAIASWPPRRRDEVEQVVTTWDSLGREEAQSGALSLGATEARVVDAWFDFLAEDGVLSQRGLALLMAGIDRSDEPLSADADALFPRTLDAAVLAKAFWDLGLDVHVDACAEILRCLPSPTSGQLVLWLHSFESAA